MANLEIIRKRWLDAPKIFGNHHVFILLDGAEIDGRYVICPVGSVTPSHQSLNGFIPSDGFPTNEFGGSVNDREYYRDKGAQEKTRDIAREYDGKAIQSPVIVSQDGVVLSGNGRTMAGEIAAYNGTDGAYIEYLKEYCQMYGFSLDDVSAFEHPRLVFLIDEQMPYTTKTFALFNKDDKKKMSKTEKAIKYGKLIEDSTFNRIIRNINQFDTIGDFFDNIKAATMAINEIYIVGAIDDLTEMYDGDTLSVEGKEMIENVLIGKAFQSNEDSVRQLTAHKAIRRNVFTALSEIATNISLGDYSLERELSEAINLCDMALSNGKIGHGDIVSHYANQTTLDFDNTGEVKTIADHNNPIITFLADLLNHLQVTRLKRVFALYNNEAKDAASGQVDMFSGGVKSKAEILSDVKKVFATLTQSQLDQKLSNAAFERRIDAVTEISEEKPNEPDTPTLPQGVTVGGYCTVILPSHKTETAKLECVIGDEACVRLKGWKRIRVPITSLLAKINDAA